jgi:hypothetical protein
LNVFELEQLQARWTTWKRWPGKNLKVILTGKFSLEAEGMTARRAIQRQALLLDLRARLNVRLDPLAPVR